MLSGLITGANGFLGLNLVEQLCAEGWTLWGLCRPGTPRTYIERFPVRVIEGDITDGEAMVRLMPEGLDAVFHTAALTTLWSRHDVLQARVNVLGTRNTARAALDKGVKRFVHTSTWNTYGLGRAEINEDSGQLGGQSWVGYVRTKFLAEQEVRALAREGLAFVILNPGHLIGRYDTKNWARMIRMLHEGTLPGVPRARGSFCHAEAVARAHISAACKGKVGENYLLPGVEASFAEVIAVIGELAGKPVPTRTLAPWLLRITARAMVCSAWISGQEPDLTPQGVELMLNDPYIASDKAKWELGYEPASLRTMIEDAYNWMSEEGILR